MSATEELRRMLDERGVEWDYGITGSTTTRFSVNGIDLTFTPMRDGLVCSTILTPEQAVEATLGEEPDDVAMLNHERIVRCEDCRYYDEIIHACEHPCVTPLRGDCPENWIFSCFNNDFCAWGERRTDG